MLTVPFRRQAMSALSRLEEFLGGKEKMGQISYPPGAGPTAARAVREMRSTNPVEEIKQAMARAQRSLEHFMGGKEKMGQISYARGACPKIFLPVEDDCEDYSSLLILPNELLRMIFSLLSIPDRLRARVNRRLWAIEADSRYYVDKLIIREQSMHSPLPALWKHCSRGELRIVLHKEKWYASDCMSKLAENANVAHLSVTLAGSDKFHYEVADQIKNFDVGMLNLDFQSQRLTSILPMGAFLSDLSRMCKLLMMNQCENIGGRDVLEVYRMMKSGAAKLRMFWVQLRKLPCTQFLTLIGIIYKDGGYICKREIEAYELVYYYEFEDDIYQRRITSIFDGMLEIKMYDEIFYGEAKKGRFELKLHESAESIAEAKNVADLTQLEVTPQ